MLRDSISVEVINEMPVEFDPGSYRDRAARVCRGARGEILRLLSPQACEEWRAISQAPFFQQAMRDRRVVVTRDTDADALRHSLSADASPSDWAGVLEHEEIPFVSYPYEWSFSMLRDAALLHLDLLIEAVHHGFTIKDGTAYNVQFQHRRPIFIDIASFERLPPGTPWTGYRQFCQTFLYPLLLQAYKGISFHPWLRGRLDGITPRECWQMMSWRDGLRRGVATHVALHAMMESRSSPSSRGTTDALNAAGFQNDLIINGARGLKRTIERLRWTPPTSNWSHYGCGQHYSHDDQQQKQQFVQKIASTRRWKQVWDLGGNIGHYGEIAAEYADLVIVADADHAAIDHCYRRLAEAPRAVAERILPLVLSVVDLSGNMGWRGRERRAFTERGKPDLVLCLALIHHVVIGHGVPMAEFIDWLADLDTSLVIEFVSRDDPMVRQMLQNRRDACLDYDTAAFESAIAARFHVRHREALTSGTRTLVFAEPKR